MCFFLIHILWSEGFEILVSTKGTIHNVQYVYTTTTIWARTIPKQNILTEKVLAWDVERSNNGGILVGAHLYVVCMG